MGETVQVPIGYKQYVYNADGFMTYFDSEPDKEVYLQEDLIDIENYIVEGKMICAEIDDESPDSEYKYLVFDMEAKALTRFATEQEYDAYAAAHQLPSRDAFKDFPAHYNFYYQKKPEWKKWLLL